MVQHFLGIFGEVILKSEDVDESKSSGGGIAPQTMQDEGFPIINDEDTTDR
jgi:hypothetical protein